MNRRRLFRWLARGDDVSALPAAQLAEVLLGAVPEAARPYVVARQVAGPVQRITFEINDLPVTLVKDGTDTAGGGTKIFDFAKGWLIRHGVAGTLTVKGVEATYAVGIGSTVQGTGGSIGSTAASFVASTAAVVPGGGAVDVSFKTDAVLAALDGTSTAIAVFLNAAIDANGTGKEDLTFSGKIQFNISNIGS